MGSWLAFGPSCARYRAVGKLRESSEKELISCNLVSRRDVLLESGGFDESLYPNEENALMDAVLKRGKLLYDPEMIVHRRPRSNFKSFAKMLFSYGGGRAQQFRLHPTAGSAINFVPPAFCVYLLAQLIFVPARVLPLWTLLPAALYLAAVLGQTAAVMMRTDFMSGLRALPLLALTNILYGAGVLRGLFSPIAHVKPGGATDIRLETVPV
jgi:hypothetical protein